LAQPARPWPTDAVYPPPSAASVRSARDLYQTTNIWLAHLKFSREQWKALEPKRIGALPHFLQPDDTALLRNPKAQRSGLAGVLGYDFNWTHSDFEFGGVAFTNVAARIKGNGTWLGSLHGAKRAFKVDLNKFVEGQKLGDLDEMAFNNLIADYSCMSDTLAYEFFRDAGVPTPRTAYAWLTVSAEGKWDRKPLGLYVMVEPVDSAFVAEHFDSKKTPVFKPVTYQLFEHMGDDWSAYATTYDLKTKATTEQQRRVIEFARLVSHANDNEFAERLGNFLDLDEFARFFAGEVLLSSYDGILSDGQNFYVYLDPRSNKFGFIPWDLDLAWGNFFLLGTAKERERASIWHPWVGQNRFLERVMAVEEFRKIYRAYLEDFSTRLFVPSRLNQRIDELAAVIRSPVAAESDFRLNEFDQAVGNKPLAASRGNSQGADRPAHQLKRFVEKRTISVRQQLDGKSEGMILKRGANK
jgi:spore coat protein CotH